MGLPFFKSVQRDGVDGVNSQRAGVDFQRMGNLQSVFVAVIDTSIRSQGDASTDSKGRNFRRNLGDAFSAFQKTRSTLSKVHVEVIIAATLLPTSVNFGDAFSAF